MAVFCLSGEKQFPTLYAFKHDGISLPILRDDIIEFSMMVEAASLAVSKSEQEYNEVPLDDRARYQVQNQN